MDERRVLMFARIYRAALARWCAGDDPAYADAYDPATAHAEEALLTAASEVADNYPFTTLEELDRWLVSWKKAPDAPPHP